MNESSSGLDLLNELAHDFAERFRRGERPALTEYIRKYPELATDIRELFPAMVVMEQFGSVAGPSGAAAAQGGHGLAGKEIPVPPQLGEYHILREVARGGMGIVYEAVQESLGRHVALKVLPFHGLLDPNHLERFRREAKAAAQLHHTNIVPVFGVGEHEGVHYFAMQFIQGQSLHSVLHELKKFRKDGHVPENGQDKASLTISLTQGLMTGRFMESGECRVECGERREVAAPSPSACDSATVACHAPSLNSFTTSSNLGQPEAQYYRSVARVGLQVANALAYAHEQGVLHRDIKPANLLLDTRGTVWVTDFGLAKAEGTEELTAPGDIVGTIRYMAPERFHGAGDQRSDIFSLGLTLYELATLQPAFTASERAQLIERILHQQPPPPSKIDPRMPRDLETIILKAIAKERDQRYGSAADLADDLGRFLADRPIRARQASAWERSWRWCRRNPVVAALLTTVAALLVVVAAGSFIAYWRVSAAKTEAEEAGRKARLREADALVGQAHGTRLSRRPGQRFDALKALGSAAAIGRELGQPPEWFDRLRNEAIAALALPDIHINQEFDGFPPGTRCVDVSDDFELYARSTDRGLCTIHRVSDDVEITRLPELGELAAAHFGPGRLVTVYGASGRFQLWDLGSAEPVLRFQEDGTDEAAPGSFRPDGRLLALPRGKDSSIRVYDTATGQRVYRVATKEIVKGLRVALHPSEPYVACFSYGQHRVTVLDLRTGAVVASANPPWSGGSGGCAWSPDGGTLAVPCGDHGVIQPYAFDPATPELRPLRPIPGSDPKQGGLWLSYNPAGDRFVMRDWHNTVHLFHAFSGQRLFSTHALPRTADGYLHFDRTGQRLAAARVGSRHSRVGLWSVADAREYRALVHSEPVSTWGDPAVHPGGRVAAIGLEDGVGLFDLEAGAELAHLPLHGKRGTTVCFDGNGSLLTNDFAGLLRWPVRQDAHKLGRLIVGPPQRLPFHKGDQQISASRDGRVIAQCMWDGYDMNRYAGGWILHPNAPMPRRVRAGPSAAFCSVSPDGRWVAFAWKPVEAYDAATGKRVWQLPAAAEGARCRFSPDGRWLATDGDGGRLYATGTWEPGPQLGSGRPCDISPDGILAVLGQTNGIYRLVEVASGRELARLEAPEQSGGTATFTPAAAFTPDGSQLVVVVKNGTSVWDLRRIRAELAKLELDWNAPSYPPAEKQHRSTLEVNVELGPFLSPVVKIRPATRFSAHKAPVRSLVFCGDGRRALSGGEEDGSVRLWDTETGKHLRCLKGHTQVVQALAVSRDRRRALSGSLDRTVRLWDIDKGQELDCFCGHTKWVTCVAFSPDGTHAASTSGDGTVRLWDLQTGRERRSFTGHPPRPGAPFWEGAQSVAFSPDGKQLLSCGYDRVLRLWDIETGQELRTFRGHTDAVLSVAVFPDGRQALSGGDDAVLRVWDVDTGKELRRLEGHRGHIHCVTISHDGRRILSCAEDGTVRLWDAASGAQLCCLAESASWLWAVAFSPDGRRALSGSADKMIRLWRLPDP